MKEYQVESSNISLVGYDVEKMELIITFSRGARYRYFKVYPETVCNMLFSQSVGKFFNQFIKDGYKCEALS